VVGCPGGGMHVFSIYDNLLHCMTPMPLPLIDDTRWGKAINPGATLL
jgi:hypothetical protein